MNEQDFDLLRRFAHGADQTAFETLVRRHLDLVYATAWRKLADSGAAEEVAQNVFAALARKAWQFAPDSSLPAWLHRCALLEAKNWLRGELRRRRREQAAVELGTTMKIADDQAAVRALIPLLDEALLSLREPDRTALLLRYYENRPLREVGSALGVGENAAQKRVATAVERLARFFQLRGYKTATVAVMAATLHHTAMSAPEFVATSVTQAALPCGASALVGSKALLAPLVTLTKLQKAAVLLVLLLAPLAVEMVRHARAAQAPPQLTPVAESPSPTSALAQVAAPPPLLPAPVALAESQTTQSPAAPAPPARRSAQAEREYSVDLRGLVELPEWKGALVAVHHRSLDRPNAPPFVAKRILRLGDTFDDRSVRGNYLKLEVLQVEAQSGNARLRVNGVELSFAMETLPQTGPSQTDAPLALLFTAPGFSEPLEFFGELVERTVLCHPSIKPASFSLAGRARDTAEAVAILEQEFRARGIALARQGEHLVLAEPTNLVKTVTAQLTALNSNVWSYKNADELLPKGAIYMENAELAQALAIYGELIGRKLIKDNPVFGRTISFRSQTPLSKAETIQAFDILLAWQGLKTLPVGDRDFRLVTLGHR